ncbi:MAG: alpha/beta hydrolase [Mangrovibacterium sp.]
MKKTIIIVLLLLQIIPALSQKEEHAKELDIPYYCDSINKSDEYINEKCRLDIYYPKNVKGFSTIVWFHGGGLTSGDKAMRWSGLVKEGKCIVSVNYRLDPKVKCPKYIEDAAAAVAWVFKNIEKYGGDTDLIFVAGHSAGAYLTSMIGLDKKWLAANHIDANKIAGLFPLSGNGITHQAPRREKGMSKMVPWVDEYAPLYHVRPDAPPLILMTGDRELEYVGRYEENAFMIRMMKLVGHTKTVLYEFDGYGHGMTGPAFPLMFKWVDKITQEIKEKKKGS